VLAVKILGANAIELTHPYGKSRFEGFNQLERSVMISSVMPSEKYSCCLSSDMLVKGNTVIDGLSGSGSGGS
jgi:hypothetical protein